MYIDIHNPHIDWTGPFIFFENAEVLFNMIFLCREDQQGNQAGGDKDQEGAKTSPYYHSSIRMTLF